MSNYAPQPPINPEEESAASLLVKILGVAAVAGAAGITAYAAKKYVDAKNDPESVGLGDEESITAPDSIFED